MSVALAGAVRSAPAAGTEPRPDLRLVLPAVAAWAGAALTLGLTAGQGLLLGLLVAGAALLALCRHQWHVGLALLVGGAACVLAALRVAGVTDGPVSTLAADQAYVSAELVLTSDPVPRQGRFGPYVLVRARVEQVTGRGTTSDVRTPVLVIAEPVWRRAERGSTVMAAGRLKPADGADLAAVLVADGPPRLLAPPGPTAGAVQALRDGLRRAAGELGPTERVLVPALVDGDDAGMPAEAVEDFRAAGLSHLLAVSGMNLTLVLGFLLPLARWCGVRARGLAFVGALGVVGFVLLARPDPSVLRAAAMGVVALAGLSAGGRRGVRALSAAVALLVLVDPWLARSVGFVLSVVATTGILVLAPAWRDALARWLPRWLAEAVAVPMAAQVACTPVVAAVFGQVSLVAVLANLAAAPAVGPATVLGLVACLVSPVSMGAAGWLAQLAGLAAGWIATVADRAAALPGASTAWPGPWTSILALTGACVVFVALSRPLLANPRLCLLLAIGLGVAIVRPPSSWGWPPTGWVLVACDVGQGDALVLPAGPGRAVVVDTGPDPAAIDRCLDRLGVSAVPLVVLTHLHADHTDGLPGVLRGRTVGEVQIGPLDSPADQFAAVRAWTSAAGVPLTRAGFGERRGVGDLAWTVLGPVPGAGISTTASEDGAAVNDASLVLLVDALGTRLLMTGDIEPAAQRALLDSGVDLRADVLKVPHHGSQYQDPAFLAAVDARLAVISVGAGNDYGHPAPETLAVLRRLGVRAARTDVAGDVAVVSTGSGGLAVASHR